MYFDTHAHYDDDRFINDVDELLKQVYDSGVTLVVNASAGEASSEKALALADRHDFVYAAVGVHPHDTEDMTENSISVLEKLAGHPKAVAIGEIGLDYHYDNSPRDIQRKRFSEQMELAASLKMPVVIHEREACADVLEILSAFRGVRGVCHCFSGSWETAKILLDMGFYLSFTGVITFKNAKKALEVIEKMPRDRLMIETDCPYLAPEPYRGKRNSSLYLPEIAKKAAEVLKISQEEAAALTYKNGKQFFGIEK